MTDYQKLIRELPRETRERLADDNPLSFSQQRLWFLDQMDPENAAYNIPAAVRLQGSLDLPALERSLNEIVRRHEVLRTAFPSFDGRPLQLIEPAYELPVHVIDLRDTPLEDREAEATRLGIEEISKSFDLARLPLIRVLLLRLTDDDHIAIVTMHHIISDGSSVATFIKEMAALYNSFSRGEEPALIELPIQYADFAHWQREWLAGAEFDRQLDYWRQQVAGASSQLQLPVDFARPLSQTFNGAEFPFELSSELSTAIKSLSRRKLTTEVTVLMAAFVALLHRYTEQQDIAIGLPVAGRNRVELEPLIGFFVNTLIIRLNLTPDLTFDQLIDRVHQTALDAYAHQDLPFEKLVEHLQPERNLGSTPLFQVMFVPQNSSNEEVVLNGLTLTPYKLDTRTAKFDLILCMGETNHGWAGALEYNTDLFSSQTIERIATHFETLLRSAAENPERQVINLCMLEAREHQRLLDEFNDTAKDYPQAFSLTDLFEAQVKRIPEALAVVGESERLTYAELNLRANRLARHLKSLGVRQETPVGICVERSPELIVSLLAVLKAGGTYIPLDPAYPVARLTFILEDSRAKVLLTEPHLRGLFGDWQGTVVYTATDEAIAHQREDNLEECADGRNLAYVIYTSGSTGRPKGVAIEHRSAVTLVNWAIEYFKPGDFAGVLASTSICFDLSVFEIFVPLSCGGAIILARDLLHVSSLSSADQITLINTVPSAMAELLRLRGLSPSVRVVNLAGEPLRASLVQQIYQHQTVERVFNLYGPSEDTTYSTAALIAKHASTPPSIGRPIANTQVYLLDSQLEPVPIRATGDLYIGGDGLARGYMGRAAMTAERFIPDPFSDKPGARLYRTGDVARYRNNGEIEFLGRKDNQVKIRGYRIELGEIEAALSAHPAIRDLVVCTHENAGYNKRLVAYIVFEPNQSASVTDLRSFLQSRLPEPWVPSVFIPLPELPLLPNSKIDRRSLPQPGTNRPVLERSYVAPRTAVEGQLAQIWARMLKIDKVGINDNFFELGGHSLLATQVISQVREAFMVELSPRRLFEEPTIERLAVLITQLQASQQEAAEMNELLNRIENLSEAEARALFEATL